VAVIVTFAMAGMAVDKYETVLRRLEAAGAGVPHGRLYHVSFGNREGLQAIDIFESRRAFEAFAATLLPILSELGVTARSEIHESYKILKS
jgi:hypothetical protein